MRSLNLLQKTEWTDVVMVLHNLFNMRSSRVFKWSCPNEEQEEEEAVAKEAEAEAEDEAERNSSRTTWSVVASRGTQIDWLDFSLLIT